ncbi:MAG: DUF494 domain-containing protein [Bacteroidetes bacterium]|nr:MAG: DUF494 domain-containing protein [Bacteroidota bacterium]
MHEKIVEILIYLIGELRKNTPLNDIDLSVLSQRGFSTTEISTAFNWLFEKISHGDAIVTETGTASPSSHRVLHEAERMVISAEAHGYLIQLRELGLISDMDIEVIIDRVMMGGFMAVDLDEVRAQVASLLAENHDAPGGGHRTMLNGNDTIN